jgi:hypothetical protein
VKLDTETKERVQRLADIGAAEHGSRGERLDISLLVSDV